MEEAARKRLRLAEDAEADTTDDLDFEDPERCWIDLVEACHDKDKARRDAKIKALLAQAHQSKWTHQIADQLQATLYDAEYGDEAATQPWGADIEPRDRSDDWSMGDQ